MTRSTPNTSSLTMQRWVSIVCPWDVTARLICTCLVVKRFHLQGETAAHVKKNIEYNHCCSLILFCRVQVGGSHVSLEDTVYQKFSFPTLHLAPEEKLKAPLPEGP